MENIKYAPEEPICAIATALAPSALGIIRCSGKNSISLVSKIFSRPKALLSAAGNTLVYGWILFNNSKIDEVMLSVYRAPKSFTGEEMIEISCHGGVGVVSEIFQILLKSGFRQAERGEFTFRSFINGKADLTKAEAIREIIESKTQESRSHAAGRLSGNLFQEINSIKQLIIDTLAAIEVEIEYPEDEETIADNFNSSKLKEAEIRLSKLNDSWKSEKLYQDGVRLVLCGKTNAGKSSLFNAILKEERAIVSDIEGTTRDWIESFASIEGLPARLFDTAGIRETQDLIEAQGVQLTKNLSEDADLILYTVDSKQGLTNDDETFLKQIKKPFILVWNKSDLNQNISLSKEQKEAFPFFKSEVKISAKTQEGFSELYKKIRDSFAQNLSTDRNQAGLGSSRQKKSVEEALEAIQHAIKTSGDYALDAVVQDLEDSLDALSEITGEICADDILSSIFSNFCVGK
ncbi:MAG: tRNA uridine-5-carboxymethylaminomethyl(34) synthesis GTPase MnmE [Treponema sp.]|nr:tRNA uridine-5-carboxymethylaminomethyl(34) synthesis GTPase MnmE [Treponema sp.]MDY5918568.1 tRNA uridine-5-carboxymethylaminomethyl(34) synthesis GTPase MnmE [Treponema sp.]